MPASDDLCRALRAEGPSLQILGRPKPPVMISAPHLKSRDTPHAPHHNKQAEAIITISKLLNIIKFSMLKKSKKNTKGKTLSLSTNSQLYIDPTTQRPHPSSKNTSSRISPALFSFLFLYLVCWRSKRWFSLETEMQANVLQAFMLGPSFGELNSFVLFLL